jgi:dolichol-phosphate mannosyltransferase
MQNNQYFQNNILIAIPVYNEYSYVDDVLTAVSKYSKNILVIDDGSDDGTEKLLGKYTFIKVVTHKTNQGYGQSLADAFRLAEFEEFEWVITMDCDHQHQPSCIPRFFDEIEKNDVDIISGSRYIQIEKQGTIKPPSERIAINRKITVLLNRTLGLELTDSFCGFKAYRVKSLKKIRLTEKGYAVPLQLWVQAAKAALEIREIPVPLIYHDPKRNFAGPLEYPKFRMQYYMDVIQRELALNGYKNTATISHS